ncbi:MAG: DUF1080 domain-containing protein, partial [Terracidiphilus sp.]
MKSRMFLRAVVLAIAPLGLWGLSNAHSAPAVQAPSAKAFLGRWDLTLRAPDGEHPSWIEISENNGKIAALFTGRWGNARPLPKVEIDGDGIVFVSPKDEESSKDDLVFKGALNGGRLSGTITGFEGPERKWTGVRAPSLVRTGAPQWSEPVELFDGKDLAGWRQSRPGPPDWTVKDGNMVSPGNGPEIISDRKFGDFKLHVEFNCGKDSNSGVYLRGRYEVQIETESESEPPSHHTGGVYGFLAPAPELPRTPDKWQTFDITLIGRHVTVVQNGTTIIDDEEIPGLTGGALDSREGLQGPIYLQGSEKGHVQFRRITIAPAK